MICLGFQKVSNCHERNVKLENPLTHKPQDDVFRANFCMDFTPYLTL